MNKIKAAICGILAIGMFLFGLFLIGRITGWDYTPENPVRVNFDPEIKDSNSVIDINRL